VSWPTPLAPGHGIAGQRVVVLPAVAAAALAEHLEEFAAPEPDGLVFPSRRGHEEPRGERQEGGRPLTCWNKWSGRRESNPHRELGKLEFCH
jgi:hypothetical protein